MLVCKSLAVYFFLCSVHCCISKPTATYDATEGRGVMTSIWGWITYPYYWWNSGETEQPEGSSNLSEFPSSNANDIVDIRSHNVTILCNDQTCNTMKCDKTGCKNVTCNIYDTDLRGECREYNIITDSNELKTTEMQTITKTPKEIIPPKPTEAYYVTSSSNRAEVIANNPVITSLDNRGQVIDNNSAAEKHPLGLEAVLSSTVNKLNVDKQSESSEDPTHKTKTTDPPKEDITSLDNRGQVMDNNSDAEERPLGLEAVLSSTVNKLNVDNHSESNKDPTTHKTKVEIK